MTTELSEELNIDRVVDMDGDMLFRMCLVILRHEKDAEDVVLTGEEVANKDKLRMDNIHTVYSEENSGAWLCIKEVGNSYTVYPSEQDQC